MIILKLTGVFEIHVHFKMIILKREQTFLNCTFEKSDEITIEYSKSFIFKYFQKTEVYLEPSQISSQISVKYLYNAFCENS